MRQNRRKIIANRPIDIRAPRRICHLPVDDGSNPAFAGSNPTPARVFGGFPGTTGAIFASRPAPGGLLPHLRHVAAATRRSRSARRRRALIRISHAGRGFLTSTRLLRWKCEFNVFFAVGHRNRPRIGRRRIMNVKIWRAPKILNSAPPHRVVTPVLASPTTEATSNHEISSYHNLFEVCINFIRPIDRLGFAIRGELHAPPDSRETGNA